MAASNILHVSLNLWLRYAFPQHYSVRAKQIPPVGEPVHTAVIITSNLEIPLEMLLLLAGEKLIWAACNQCNWFSADWQVHQRMKLTLLSFQIVLLANSTIVSKQWHFYFSPFYKMQWSRQHGEKNLTDLGRSFDSLTCLCPVELKDSQFELMNCSLTPVKITDHLINTLHSCSL